MFMYLYYIIFKSCYRVPSIKQYNSTLFFVFAFIVFYCNIKMICRTKVTRINTV